MPNGMVMISRLPERAAASQVGVNLSRRETLEGLNEPRKGLVIPQSDDSMDMIRHYDETKPSAPFIVFKPIKGFKYNGGNLRVCKKWFSVNCGKRKGVVGVRYGASTFPQVAVSAVWNVLHSFYS